MAHLFILENNIAKPNTETLLLEPFKTIWERDKTKNKEKAIREFTYIEFMTSALKSNPFREYPEDKKHSVISEHIFKEDYKPDKLVKDGINFIVKLQEEASTTYIFWLANKRVIEKQIDFLNNLDPNERNFKTGSPLYKPKDIPDAVAQSEKALSTINALKKKVEEELFDTVKTKGQKEISPFAMLN